MCLELPGEHRDEGSQGGTERGRQHPWLGSRAWSRHGKMEHDFVGRGSNKGGEKLLVRSWKQRGNKQDGKRGGPGYKGVDIKRHNYVKINR